MINYIFHNQIDRARYDACIENSISCRTYAYSWYLDAVCETWDVFMTGNYEVVMPVPKRKKYGLSYVFTPSWVQQLGIFSSRDISTEESRLFKETLASKFHWIDYHFNSGNLISDGQITVKKNYVLPLNGEFRDLLRNYNKNRKRASSVSLDHLVLDKEGSLEVFIKNYHAIEKPYKIEEDSMKKLMTLAQRNPQHVHIWNVFDDNGFRGGLIWAKDSKRITYLLPVANEKAKNENIPTFVINELIKDHLNQGLVLDFEGSMISGVANFYKSFGADEENYYYFKKRFFNHA
ncbi:hypothetical protein LCM02_00950 [Lutimonas saemankumensis]|uniref:hypothetical protein n=1 Tax=Lutimonas saemankumensis TaxID=483016 RepID=UPI001CD24FDD|nr:hypothetical protein [Lutimonas saemankumensis]MCA0930995.1 hypothetical protein [Lutimonas saemankumensis]